MKMIKETFKDDSGYSHGKPIDLILFKNKKDQWIVKFERDGRMEYMHFRRFEKHYLKEFATDVACEFSDYDIDDSVFHGWEDDVYLTWKEMKKLMAKN